MSIKKEIKLSGPLGRQNVCMSRDRGDCFRLGEIARTASMSGNVLVHGHRGEIAKRRHARCVCRI